MRVGACALSLRYLVLHMCIRYYGTQLHDQPTPFYVPFSIGMPCTLRHSSNNLLSENEVVGGKTKENVVHIWEKSPLFSKEVNRNADRRPQGWT